MAQYAQSATSATVEEPNVVRLPAGTDLIEWYFGQGWTDGLPVVPPTRARVDAFVETLGGHPHHWAGTRISSNARCRRVTAACRARSLQSTW